MKQKCYMCDNDGTTVEHVPPQCFFPEKKDLPHGVNLRRNLITVPSCIEHNTKKSKDDEYVRFIVVSHIGNNLVAANLFLTKILRAIERRPALRSVYNAETKAIVSDGVKAMAFKVNTSRYNTTMQKIMRGLYFHHYGEQCSLKIMVQTPALLALKDCDPQMVINMKKTLMAKATSFLNESSDKYGDNPEVFYYQIHREVHESSLFVKMVFYEGVEVLGISHPSILSAL